MRFLSAIYHIKETWGFYAGVGAQLIPQVSREAMLGHEGDWNLGVFGSIESFGEGGDGVWRISTSRSSSSSSS